MARYRVTIAYRGTHYRGWQRQAAASGEGRSIQELFEAAAEEILGASPRFIASGRTDSGVHARRQVLHFDAHELRLAPSLLLKALNSKLPADVRVLSLVETTADFHAQRSATAKTYRYFLLNGADKGRHINWPFLRPYTWFVPQPLDLAAMRKALALFQGEQDFASFQNKGTAVKSTVREIFTAELIEHRSNSGADLPWLPPPELELQLLEVRLRGSGFLKQMVRNILGTLVEVGLGKLSEADVKQILAAKDRTRAGITAPPQGLFLEQVEY